MILITGATGFIGKKLLEKVKREYKNEKVCALSRSECNLVTRDGIDKLPKNPRIIFHLAGATDTSKRDQKCNIIGTKNLLNALPGIGPDTHIIYTSSQVVFSDRKDTDSPITENTKAKINNRYGKSKLEAERFLKESARKRKFKLTIVRLPTVWGENPRKNAFLNFLKIYVAKKSVFTRLNWPGKVALVNVEDAADFILKSADKSAKTIAIATENLTLAEIFEKLIKSKGGEYRQIRVPSFIWNTAKNLKPYMKYFEPILPAKIYNYFWRASIVIDSPLWCKENLKGKKFTE